MLSIHAAGTGGFRYNAAGILDQGDFGGDEIQNLISCAQGPAACASHLTGGDNPDAPMGQAYSVIIGAYTNRAAVDFLTTSLGLLMAEANAGSWICVSARRQRLFGGDVIQTSPNIPLDGVNIQSIIRRIVNTLSDAGMNKWGALLAIAEAVSACAARSRGDESSLQMLLISINASAW